MAEEDEASGMPPAAPGMRWVLVRDDRLTNRLRSMQVPLDAPEPVDPGDTPEMIARTRGLVADLLNRQRADRAEKAETVDDSGVAGEGP